MAERYFDDGHWWHDVSLRSWVYTESGYYDIGVQCEPKYVIDSKAIAELVATLDKEGWIKPRLDERLRVEDLKITHRLIDLLNKAIG